MLPKIPAPLRILIAENNADDGRLLTHNIQVKMSDKMSIDVEVQVVTTLEKALGLATTANVTILDLNLDDAGPEEVMAAIPKFGKPVVILTGEDDPATHAKCFLAGADFVFEKTKVRGLYDALTVALARDIRASLAEQAK